MRSKSKLLASESKLTTPRAQRPIGGNGTGRSMWRSGNSNGRKVEVDVKGSGGDIKGRALDWLEVGSWGLTSRHGRLRSSASRSSGRQQERPNRALCEVSERAAGSRRSALAR